MFTATSRIAGTTFVTNASTSSCSRGLSTESWPSSRVRKFSMLNSGLDSTSSNMVWCDIPHALPIVRLDPPPDW